MGAEPVPREEARTGPGRDTGRQRVTSREVVTGPPRATARDGHPCPTAPEQDRLPAHDFAVRSLMRRQLRTALMATGLLTALLGLLPVVLRTLPLSGARPGAPLAVWLVLGVAPYPALLGIGAWYVRRAERNEGDVKGR
ncbi:hypothetical protein [Streptomyces sp. NPDC005573]|uniref:hypothetical protein n=1 Tax=Streptomyces sp. NPDC005573 TaxID=3156890 RepID=UPI00339E6249